MKTEEEVREQLKWVVKTIKEEGTDDWLRGFKIALQIVLMKELKIELIKE